METLAIPVLASDVRQELVKDHDKTLEKIYAKVYPMVLHHVKQHSGTAHDAQDLVQEAIILFYEKVMQEQLSLTSAPSTYIVAICKNLWKRELEKRSRRHELSQELHDELQQEETPAQPAQKLATFVEKLGEKCSQVLVSFYYLGERMEQIAEKLQYGSVRSATVQKFKCLERLRKSLAAYTIHDFR